MNDIYYADLVLCSVHGSDRHRLFEAPFCSGLREGDEVVVSVGGSEMHAVVREVMCCRTDSEGWKFAVKTAKAEEPLCRVIKTVTYTPFDWKSIDEERKERGVVETEKA